MRRFEIDVEDLKQKLRQQTIITNPFRFNTSFQSCYNLIDYHYQCEVWKRHKDFVSTDKYKKLITEFSNALLDTDYSKFCICLFGVYGNGKTTLINAFDNAVRFMDKDKNIFAEDMKETHKRYDPVVMDAKQLARLCNKDIEEYEKLIDCNILCIDDCGTEPTLINNYGTVYAPVADMLEYRYSRQLFTIITTNLLPTEFYDKYGGRIKDRFDEILFKIVSENESYRPLNIINVKQQKSV